MTGSIGGYRDLLVWQRAMLIAEQTYLITKDFPREEQFGMTSQARRAAASVAANIAEGYGRGTRPAYASFVRIAQGSLKELETHLMLAERVGLIASGKIDSVLDPPSFQWTPMLAFRSWRGVSDECSTPGFSGIVQAGGR